VCWRRLVGWRGGIRACTCYGKWHINSLSMSYRLYLFQSITLVPIASITSLSLSGLKQGQQSSHEAHPANSIRADNNLVMIALNHELFGLH
jgi:hypothetical protein